MRDLNDASRVESLKGCHLENLFCNLFAEWETLPPKGWGPPVMSFLLLCPGPHLRAEFPGHFPVNGRHVGI